MQKKNISGTNLKSISLFIIPIFSSAEGSLFEKIPPVDAFKKWTLTDLKLEGNVEITFSSIDGWAAKVPAGERRNPGRAISHAEEVSKVFSGAMTVLVYYWYNIVIKSMDPTETQTHGQTTVF